MSQLCKSVSILVILFFSQLGWSETLTSLGLNTLSFISSDYETSQKNFTFLGATLRSDEKHPEQFMTNISGFYAVGSPALTYLNVRELYFYFPASNDASSAKIYLGRKIMNWSALDSDFNLGFFQPQFRWNTLQPENQGLFGFFWDRQNTNWGFTAFASHLFLPDQGASYEIKDGKFEETNPFLKLPPQRIRFQGQILPIDYKIEKPEAGSVINRPLLAAQLRLGAGSGFFSQFSAAYKPSHQLALGYSGVLVTTRVKINIVPKVYNEKVFASDLGYRADWGSLQVSVLHTQPENPTFENSANVPIFQNSTTWGPRFTYNFDPFTLSLAFFDTYGGRVTEKGPDSDPDRASLSQRFLYRQAIQGQIKYSEILLKKMRLDSQLQYTYSELDKFTQINFKNKINLNGPWAFWSNVILIETADDANLNINVNRNLDQLWLGVSYDI